MSDSFFKPSRTAGGGQRGGGPTSEVGGALPSQADPT